MRRIIAFIDADEEKLLEYHPDDGVGVAFEEEMGRVQQRGIHVDEWAISDADDTNLYARYLHYLFHWTMNHAENFDVFNSPMDYVQWQKNEYGADPGKAFLLISVFEREIMTEGFFTQEAAKAAMLAELKKEFLKENEEGEWEHIAAQEEFECDCFGFGSDCAWSNLDDDCNCDWRIISLPPVITD